MLTHTDAVRFLKLAALTVLTGVILAVGTVVVLDPYHLYGFVDRVGFNHVKPRPDRFQQMIKVANARALPLDLLIIGNSRAEIGLNPEHPALVARHISAYNASLPGSRIGNNLQDLSYLIAEGKKPTTVIFGAEFLDYPVKPEATSPDQKAILQLIKWPHKVTGWKWQFDAAFSMTSLADALQVLRIQHNAEAETLTARGFNPLLDYKKFARDDGYYGIFQQRAIDYAQSFNRKPHGLRYNRTGSSPDIDYLRKTLALMAANAEESHVIIYPYHAQILAMFEETGLLPLMEQWKRMLVEEVALANRLNSPKAQADGQVRPRIQLWDFSGYSTIQCEKIPAQNDKKSVTQWYWEAGHFKQSLGDLILEQVLAQRLQKAPTQLVGTALNAENFEANQQRLEREKAQCRADYPALFEQVKKLVHGSAHSQ